MISDNRIRGTPIRQDISPSVRLATEVGVVDTSVQVILTLCTMRAPRRTPYACATKSQERTLNAADLRLE